MIIARKVWMPLLLIKPKAHPHIINQKSDAKYHLQTKTQSMHNN